MKKTRIATNFLTGITLFAACIMCLVFTIHNQNRTSKAFESASANHSNIIISDQKPNQMVFERSQKIDIEMQNLVADKIKSLNENTKISE